MTEVAEYKSAAEMMAAYKARRARMMGRPKFVNVARQKQKQVAELDDARKALDERERKRKAEEAYKRIMAQYREVFTPNHPDQPVHLVIREIASRFGVALEDITAPASASRTNSSVEKARFKAIYEVKRRFPNTSMRELGRIFGGRNHNTIIYALRKMGYYDRKAA